MAKINFSALFQTPLAQFKHFLIFGNDLSVFERSIFFLHQKIPFPLQKKKEKDFLNFFPSSLFKELEDSPLTLIPQVTDKIIPHLSERSKDFFIFTSEKARSSSKLVTYFTHFPHCLAIAAYTTPVSIAEFECLTQNLNLPQIFKKNLFKFYEKRPQDLIGVLEKIRLFGEISESHYALFLESSSSEETSQALRDAFLLKDVKRILPLLLSLNPADLIITLRNLARTFLILFELMPYKASPHLIKWQALSSPVFFKDYPLFEKALSSWGSQEIKTLLERLLFLEDKVKHASLTPTQGAYHLFKIVSRETISAL